LALSRRCSVVVIGLLLLGFQGAVGFFVCPLLD